MAGYREDKDVVNCVWRINFPEAPKGKHWHLLTELTVTDWRIQALLARMYGDKQKMKRLQMPSLSRAWPRGETQPKEARKATAEQRECTQDGKWTLSETCGL